MHRSAVTLLAIPMILALGSCANEETDGRQVTGDLTEWSVSVDATSIPVGDVTFRITNAGSLEHEFLVVKTDIPDGQIPVVGGLFPEDLETIEVIDEIPPFAPGRSEELTLNLSAGRYQLVCNIPGHYQAGMHTSISVE